MMSFALTTSLFAQVTLIPKAGVSWAHVSFNDDINDQFAGEFDYGSKAGLIIGIAAAIPMGGDRFTLQPELLFHQKGYTSKYVEDEISSSYETTLNYLEVPVLARVNFGKFYAATGTYIGFGVGGKYKGSDTYMGHTEQHEGNVKFGKEPDNYDGSNEYINTLDLGIQLGAGVKVSVIVIDFRFGLGLNDNDDEGDFDTQTRNQPRNRSLQLTIGFPVGSGK